MDGPGLRRRALRALLNRFPDHESGLNHWEEQLVARTPEMGPRVARVMGFVLGDSWDGPDWVSDAYLVSRIVRFSKHELARPVLSTSAPIPPIAGVQMELTAHGIAILEGEASFLDTDHVDDRVGGVHLDSRAGSIWLRRGDDLVEPGRG